ncbi:glycine zipper 2TM domain-containing protein [Sphingomonas sp.]|uniref:glycine zipper 2TM domain-containing protein n=1 Tax=Sphingomonas sp. TaxID=28214 RepID=UPI002601169E|nr:glycine zipper 2TM domain-containing protein [Sphingomonas sp.]
MRTLTLGLLAAATALTGCETMYDDGPGTSYRTYRNYDWNRPDPQYSGYYADHYYVDNPRYRERRLGMNDRIYVGQDGRYYCRRSDGTTGLIVGGIAGGALGAALTSGRSEPLGILLGAAAGAAVGTSIDRDNVTCR